LLVVKVVVLVVDIDRRPLLLWFLTLRLLRDDDDDNVWFSRIFF